MAYAVELDGISMKYNLYSENINSLKEYVLKLIKGVLRYNEFIALSNINLRIEQGEIFGIIGANGSGKSTLLKLISGIYKPAEGSLLIRGRIAPLIELGAGFDYELTARENIYMNGAILGYTKYFVQKRETEILKFAELEEFKDIPIKNFSSGMLARLGFAIATIVDPDILVVDEILAVGDLRFQEKCETRIKEIIDNGTTVILVSHNLTQVKRLCDRVLWLDKGQMKCIGSADLVCETYRTQQ
jgi:ABC-type polysaccharide/polyol phosphate transport system ATPase subunit